MRHDLDVTAAAQTYVQAGLAATDPGLPALSRAQHAVEHQAMLTLWCALSGLDPTDPTDRRIGAHTLILHASEQTYADLTVRK